MTLEEIGERIREILPEAVFGEDGDGQLIIYTNLRVDGTPFEEGGPEH